MALKSIFEYEEKTEAAEIYLCFFHNVGCVFDQLVKKLEETTLCITDVYEEVQNEDASAETGQLFWIPDQAADGQTIVSTKVQAATGL